MKLTDLDPEFIRITSDDGSFRRVETMAEAQGVMFLCPTCFKKNGGAVGTHAVICWSRSRGVPNAVEPGTGRWMMVGTGFDDLTLNADPPSTARSVDLGVGEWHGFITNGEIK